MGRVGRKTARVQVSSRLAWTFSARAALGRARPRRSAPVSAAGVHLSAAVVRSLLRAVRPHPRRPALPRASRIRRIRAR
ncbi:hypothetical protein ACWELO_34940 [Streptomyces sp. NPDC004596]|uniref:hypothetical protein n=1 Tax=Streptomyces sp. DSM 118148 TaxID=3448667 RepID=UPI00403FEABF